MRGELQDGDALPPEMELVERYGISRPTLREAFRVLESESLISVRRGARGGARVHAPTLDVAARNAGVVLQHRGTTMADIYLARTVIEVPCAGRLAQRRTRADLDLLWTKVEEAEAAIDEPDRFIRLHTEFHGLIVDLAGNQTLALLNGMVRHIIDLANWTRVARDPGGTTPKASHRGAKAHRRLVEHIEAKDPDAAEALVAHPPRRGRRVPHRGPRSADRDRGPQLTDGVIGRGRSDGQRSGASEVGLAVRRAGDLVDEDDPPGCLVAGELLAHGARRSPPRRATHPVARCTTAATA